MHHILAYVLAITCVAGIVFGQIAFKMSAISLNESDGVFTSRMFLLFFSALSVYFISSLLWVWVLRNIELSKVYPLMSLAFVMVPIASQYMFDESFNSQYFLGVFIIMFGVVVTTSS